MLLELYRKEERQWSGKSRQTGTSALGWEIDLLRPRATLGKPFSGESLFFLVVFASLGHLSDGFAWEAKHSTVNFHNVLSKLFLRLYEL